MPDPSLRELALCLQHSLENIGTMGMHQHVLLGFLGHEIQTAEQEALIFALDCCQAAELDWRVEAEEKVNQLLKLADASNT